MIHKYLLRDTPYWLNFVFTGQMYIANHIMTIGAGLTSYLQANTQTMLIHGLTRILAVEGGGPILYQVLEEPFTTLTDGTLPIDCISNMDRRSTKTNEFTYYRNPTNVTGGTLIEQGLVATGGGPQASAALEMGLAERVYKQNTKYIFRATNQGAQPSTVSYSFLWYESGN